MLKYVAIIQVTNREILGRYTAGAKHRNYKSPISEDKKEAEKWLEVNLKMYSKDQYIVDYGLVAFEADESKNAEKMFEKLMYVF